MEEMKVIKEQTDFGEITVVVIDGECYFLFSEVDAVMQLGKFPDACIVHYPSEMYMSVRDGKSWRIEDIPGVGEEQLLIEMRAVYDAANLSRNIVAWKKDVGEINEKKAKERLKAIGRFTFAAHEMEWKHEDRKRQAEKIEPLVKAMSEIIGEEIFE